MHSTCQNHSSTLSTPISLNPDSQNSFHSRVALPTNPFQSPSKPTSFHSNLSTPELINPVKLDRGSQRPENKRATCDSLVRELPPPNRVEIEIGYRTNREHGRRVTAIEKESLDRIERRLESSEIPCRWMPTFGGGTRGSDIGVDRKSRGSWRGAASSPVAEISVSTRCNQRTTPISRYTRSVPPTTAITPSSHPLEGNIKLRFHAPALPHPPPRLFGSHSLAPRPPYSSSRPLEADRLHERRAHRSGRETMLAFFTLFFFPSLFFLFLSFLHLERLPPADSTKVAWTSLRVGAVMRSINGKGTLACLLSRDFTFVVCCVRGRDLIAAVFEKGERVG